MRLKIPIGQEVCLILFGTFCLNRNDARRLALGLSGDSVRPVPLGSHSLLLELSLPAISRQVRSVAAFGAPMPGQRRRSLRCG